MASKPTPKLEPLTESMIAEAAYYRAEHRGFMPGFAMDDWLAAEHEIQAALRSRMQAAPSAPAAKRKARPVAGAKAAAGSKSTARAAKKPARA